MSLLMEALKKAEKTRQESAANAPATAEGGNPSPPEATASAVDLSLTSPQPAASAPPVEPSAFEMASAEASAPPSPHYQIEWHEEIVCDEIAPLIQPPEVGTLEPAGSREFTALESADESAESTAMSESPAIQADPDSLEWEPTPLPEVDFPPQEPEVSDSSEFMLDFTLEPLTTEPGEITTIPIHQPLSLEEPAPAAAPMTEASNGLRRQAPDTERSEIPDTPLLRSKPANAPKPAPSAKPSPPALSVATSPPPEKNAPSPEKAARVIAAAAPPPRKHYWTHLAALLLLFGLGGGGYYVYTEYLHDLMNQPVIPPPPRLPPISTQPSPAAAPANTPQAPPVVAAHTQPKVEAEPAPPAAAPEIKPEPIAKVQPPAAATAPPPAPVEESPAPPKKSSAAVKSINPLPPESLQIRRNEAVDQLNQTVQRAYAAYQAGDRKTARNAYLQVLVSDSRNRDALLGLAGLAVLDKDLASARRYYREVLRLFPGDVPAQTGLNSLEGGQTVQNETQIKLALAQTPNAGYLHFQLGNLYSGQQRWGEAQQAYFDAHRNDLNQPDYAFNLAVSLERLNQPKAALEFYRKALQLAASRPAGFAADSARQRIAALSPAAPDTSPTQPLP